MTNPVKVEQLGAGQAHLQKTVCQLPQVLQAVDSLFSLDRSLACNKPLVSVHNYTKSIEPNRGSATINFNHPLNNKTLGKVEVSL